MSSARLLPSSVIASTSAQQTGHQATNVLPLYTTSRLSVSIVILVVFITTYAPIRLPYCSGFDWPHPARISREKSSMRCSIFLNEFQQEFFSNKCKGLRRIEGQLPE
jgi:hypothetical protein